MRSAYPQVRYFGWTECTRYIKDMKGLMTLKLSAVNCGESPILKE
jgi:hypothetical protein